jgi:hypothetical protein
MNEYKYELNGMDEINISITKNLPIYFKVTG